MNSKRQLPEAMPQNQNNSVSASNSPIFQPFDHYPKAHLLGLPFSVRRRIYDFIGFIRPCPINLGSEKLNSPDQGGNKQVRNSGCWYKRRLSGATSRYRSSTCCCDPIEDSLFYTCRLIYLEVSSIFWSENKFKLDLGGWRSQLPLHLTSRIIPLLTCLSVRLNTCSCTLWHRCDESQSPCSDCKHSCIAGRDRPMDMISYCSNPTVKKWEELANMLAKHIQPSRMRFIFICDTANSKVAGDIVKPLLDFPRLRDCAIRLGQDPRFRSIQNLAETTACRLTGQLAGFPFLNLPLEIQRHVLRLTDLVCHQHLEWDPRDGLSAVGSGAKDCCAQCTATLETCCCPLLHAASSSVPCKCWKMPLALFLVNRSVHHEAKHIFFSKNHFIIPLISRKSRLVTGSSDQFSGSIPIIQLFDRIPASSRYLFRSIQLAQERIGYPTIQVEHWPRYEKYLGLIIGYIVMNLSVSRLTLTLDINSSHMIVDDYSLRDDEHELSNTSERILAPILKLTGLKNLFIFLHKWNSKDEKFRMRREQLLEKRVMGEDYDSSRNGKGNL